MNGVKKTIIRFALQQGLTSVRGSSYEATISSEKRLLLPPTGTPEREALEDVLKELMLYGPAITVNWRRLNSLWQSGELPGPAVEALQSYVSGDCEEIVGLKKLNGQGNR